jgi:hypothetical protein
VLDHHPLKLVGSLNHLGAILLSASLKQANEMRKILQIFNMSTLNSCWAASQSRA